MIKIATAILVVLIAGCGTLGGTISGAGQDLSKLGGWIKDK